MQYFLRVSQAQEEVQAVQNQLATHLRFNPALLFRKYPKRDAGSRRATL